MRIYHSLWEARNSDNVRELEKSQVQKAQKSKKEKKDPKRQKLRPPEGVLHRPNELPQDHCTILHDYLEPQTARPGELELSSQRSR
jgi:hypothetical protein